MARVRRPKPRVPPYPPWDKSECERCATPVRRVNVAGPERHVFVGMLPAPLSDKRADYATTTMDGQLVGWRHLPGDKVKPDELLWISHDSVCPELPHPEQLALPTEETT